MADQDGSKTVQWAPDMPVQQQSSTSVASKMPQASTGACDACRARKVRCLANESSLSSKCQRCARAGRECVYTVHSKTRRRKRTDTRVKELEEKVKSLSLLLEQGKSGKATSKAPPTVQKGDEMGDDEEGDWSEEDEADGTNELQEDLASPEVGNSRGFDGYAAYTQTPLGQGSGGRQSIVHGSINAPRKPSVKHTPTGSVSPDVIERGLLTLEKAQELFDRYVQDLAPNYPAVVIPQGASAAGMRKERPILFLAAVAAGASNQDPALNLALNQEIMQVYANKVALGGEKSLELVMSILVSTLWYYPPDKFEELKFHQYIHMAATMALDIGIGKRPRVSRLHETRPYEEASRGPLIPDVQDGQRGKDRESPAARSFPNSAAIESRRTLLACYVSCAGVSMSLRLPNMLRFTSWMGECVDYLDSAPEAAPTDKRFAAWIRIQRLVEECVIAFSLDDPGSTVSLQDVRVQQMLKGYENQFARLSADMRAVPGLMNNFLEINVHLNNVFMHEIALHPEHDPEDFRPPFFIAANTSKTTYSLSPVYISALSECITSAQTVLETFTSMPVDEARAVPALLYVRIIYCSIILIKLDVSANTPSSQIGKIIDRSSLMTRQHLEKALLQLKRIAGTDDKNPLSAKFCMILGKLVSWYRQTIDSSPARTDNGAIEPCKAFGRDYNPQEIPSDPKHALAQPPKYPKEPLLKTMTTSPNTQFGSQPGSQPQNLVPIQGVSHYPTPRPSPYPAAHNPIESDPNFTLPQTGLHTHHAPARHPADDNSFSLGRDQSSTEYIDQNAVAKMPYQFPMAIDPSMFNQLQGVNPFGDYQDPNPHDWMFDETVYANIPNMAGPEFDWSSMPEQQ